MNVVDSSGWLEYFADAPNANFFAAALGDQDSLVVPSLSIYEVFRRTAQLRDEGDALQVAALMQQGLVVDLTASLALSAARLSLREQLPLAASVILATAHAYGATLWTQDADFAGIEGVQYVSKKT